MIIKKSYIYSVVGLVYCIVFCVNGMRKFKQMFENKGYLSIKLKSGVHPNHNNRLQIH